MSTPGSDEPWRDPAQIDELLESSAQFAAPNLHGRTVYLRALTPQDYAHLQMAETSTELAPRWRFRGETPAPEQWAQATLANVLAQFLVVERDGDRPIGTVAVFNANFQDGHCSLAAARLKPDERTPAMMFGLALFLRYVFTCWNFRKLYMDVAQYNFDQFASGAGKFFEIEGRLRDYSWYGGRYWDKLILSVSRETFRDRGAAVLRIEDPG
jgi:RimJ/RimL family protein N-acetyltransferase